MFPEMTGIIISLFLLFLYAEAESREGTIFPSEVSPLIGQEVMLRLDSEYPLLNQILCVVTTNKDVNHTFSLSDMDEPQKLSTKKITYWGGPAEENDCGVRIRNITNADYGRWTLSSQDSDGNVVVGHSTISKTYPRADMEERVAFVKLSEEYVINFEKALIEEGIKPMYCKLRRPNGQMYHESFSTSCSVTLPTVTKRDLGTWTASVGVVGSTDEHVYRYTLKEIDRSLKFGSSPSITTNKKAMNLYCNIQENDVTLKICRFIRPGDKASLNMEDNLGDGLYSYFGKGLASGECGITLENPGKLDTGTWRCLLYTEQKYGTPPTVLVGADIIVNIEVTQALTTAETETLNVVLNSSGTVSCSAGTDLSHCSVLSPNGEGIMGSELGFAMGLCSVHVENFVKNQTGTWICIMTPSYGGGDLQAYVQVNVVESPLIAEDHQVSAQLTQPLTLMCKLIASPPSITHCRFVRPDGTGYNLVENADLIDGRYKYAGRGLVYGECGLKIENVHTDDHGTWTCSVRAQMDELEKKETIQVSIEGTSNMFPSDTTVDRNTDTVLSMTDVCQNQVRCLVQMPDGTTVDLSSPSSQLVSYWGAGINLDECGVKIKVGSLPITSEYKLDEHQTWRLTSVGPKGENKTAIGWIKVIDDRRLAGRGSTTLQVDLGQDIDVSCDSEGSDYCILVPPGKDAKRYTPSDCRTFLKPVKNEHLGNWTCIMGFSSSTREVVDTISLVNKGSGLSVGIDSSSSSNVVKLYCKVSQPLNFCRFVSPNDTVFVLNDGMASGRYYSWGKGLAAGDCGIAISTPYEGDRGLWKCFVGGKTGDIQGGYIVLSDEEVKPWTSAGDKVFTTRGSSLSLECHAAASLLYCWYRHPNGTQLPVVGGDGLEAGDCRLTLQDAQPSDSGEWTCHMGMQSTAGEELVASINVVVKEESFFSNASEVQTGSSATLTLMCRAIPAGAPLQYCRWVSPEGKVIRPNSENPVGGRYWYAGASLYRGECGLRIVGVADEDYGVWTCAAVIQGQGKEVRATVVVSPVPESSSSFSLIGGIISGVVLGLIVVTIIIFIIRRRMKRSSTENDINLSELRERRQSATSSVSSCSSGNLVHL